MGLRAFPLSAQSSGSPAVSQKAQPDKVELVQNLALGAAGWECVSSHGLPLPLVWAT